MIARRAPDSAALPVSTIILATLCIGLLSALHRQEAATAQPALTADLQIAPSGGGRSIPRAADGLFHIDVQLNGAPIRLVLDTGANVTVLSTADARRAGLRPDMLAYDERLSTGGGHIPIARTVLPNAHVMGRDFANLPVVVAREHFPVSVLGQDVLRRLPAFSIAGDSLMVDVAIADAA